MTRSNKLLVWAAVFLLIGVLNASIYGNTGRAYHGVLALFCGVVAMGWFVWSEVIRFKKEKR